MEQLLHELSTKSVEISSKLEELIVTSKLLGYNVKQLITDKGSLKLIIYVNNETIKLHFKYSTTNLCSLSIKLTGSNLIRTFEQAYGNKFHETYNAEIKKSNPKKIIRMLHSLIQTV